MGIIIEIVGDGESSSKPEPTGGSGSNYEIHRGSIDVCSLASS